MAQVEVSLHPLNVKSGEVCWVTVENRGPSAEKVELRLNDPNDAILPQAIQEIELDPEQSAQLRFEIKAKNRPIVGKTATYPFTISINQQLHQGEVTVTPLLPIWSLGLIALLFLGGTTIALIPRLLRPDIPMSEPAVTVCAEPLMPIFRPKIIATPINGLPQQPQTTLVDAPLPQRAIQSLQFLDLPFPYDGGNENFSSSAEQFRQAVRSGYNGGRVNSYFDHYYPLYPAPSAGNVTQGGESAEPPVGGNMLLYTGELVSTSYSGHPAYDFSPYIPRTATTPLFASADGTVHDVGIHAASGAYYVRIRHTVPNAGDFITTYWHLHPDQFFEAMRPRVGQPIRAGERVGTIGNTGWSTGHHLHFEVRFDRNQDGSFSASEAVDPFGFVPSADFPADPWGIPSSANGTGSISHYLWVHSLGYSAIIPNNGGGTLPATGGGTGGEGLGCAPANSLPPGGTLNWSWSADPAPTTQLAGVGEGCALAVFDANNNAVNQFAQPLRIELPFGDTSNIDPSTLQIHWKNQGSTQYQPLPTELDMARRVAIAYTMQGGHCALLGRPIRDLVAPTTKIEVTGNSFNGAFYDEVTVNLSSDDPNLDRIEYSLDGGTTWQRYKGSFVLKANGVPTPISGEIEEALPLGPGRFVVLASGTDKEGNYENPPRSRLIVIDPSQNPVGSAEPDTPTPTPLPSETATATATALPPTATPTLLPPTATPTPLPTGIPTYTPSPIPSKIPTATPTATVRPTETPTPEPTLYQYQISFNAKETTIVAGNCTSLSWQTNNVGQILLLGQAQPWQGTLSVCPTETTTYQLNVTLFNGQKEIREVTVTVIRPTETATPTAVPILVPTPLKPRDVELPCAPRQLAATMLTWSGTPNATYYEYNVEIDFGQGTGDWDTIGGDFAKETAVNVDLSQYCGYPVRWRVRAYSDAEPNGGKWSDYAYFQIANPAQPDLVVTSWSITQENIDLAGDVAYVPAQVTLYNQGSADASSFKVAIWLRSPRGFFPVSFLSQYGEYYAYVEGLGAGRAITIEGVFLVPIAYQEFNLSASAEVDSCSGEEFAPEGCFVAESRETNNFSAEIPFTLPAP